MRKLVLAAVSVAAMAGLAACQNPAEKEAAAYPLPRAAHIDHEGMRILQEAGAADEVYATSRRVARYEFLNGRRRLLMIQPRPPRRSAGRVAPSQ